MRTPPINIVTAWFEDLKERVPVPYRFRAFNPLKTDPNNAG